MVKEAGEQLIDVVARTINGRLTAAEAPRAPGVHRHQAPPQRVTSRAG